MKKIRIKSFVLLISLVSCLCFISSVCFASGYTIIPIPVQTNYWPVCARFDTPLRSSSGFSTDSYAINEKYSQMRLWTSSDDTHEGVDFTCGKGTNVYSVYSGTVAKIYTNNVNLKTIVIKHDYNLTSTTQYVYSVYTHLNTICVSVGENVSSSTIIGTSGPPTTSQYNYHLHFGLTSNGSSSYSSLVWVPCYPFYKNTSYYNYGKDFDYLYNYKFFDYQNQAYISGYFKGDSSSTRNALNGVKLYYRTKGSSSSFSSVDMNSIGNYEWKYDLDNLNLPNGREIEYFFKGYVTTYRIDAGYHWQYYPAKNKYPTDNPNSNLNQGFNFLYYTQN